MMSGFGLYYSLNKGFDWRSYLKKRFLRVFPDYFIAVCFATVVYKYNIGTFITQLTTLDFWLENKITFWFISLIAVLYVLFPIIYRMINRSRLTVVLMFAGLIILFICLELFAKDYYCNRLIAFDRIFIFIIGGVLGKASCDKKQITNTMVCLLFLIGLALGMVVLLISIPHYRLLYITLAVSLSFVFCKSMTFTSLKHIKTIFTWLGALSLDIYLFHELILRLNNTILADDRVSDWVRIIITTVITVLVSILINSLSINTRRRMKNICPNVAKIILHK